MKLIFLSNFLNHHQLPFCKEMYKHLGDDFKFIATEKIPDERINMGYKDMSKDYPFSLNINDDETYKEALELSNKSEVVIIGSAPNNFVKERITNNKLTYYYSERIFKKGVWKVLNPRCFYHLYKNHIVNKNKNVYMLCASAFTAFDFNLIGAYKNKTFKWGYFPEVKEYDIETLMQNKKNKVINILWVGRFIYWKHPDYAIRIANKLKKDGYSFKLNLIGTGPLEKKLKQLLVKYDLQENVSILGKMSPEEVRNNMEKANIFLFTSDYNEGWGAVLNEAMNSGCAVIASSAIGSVPFLVKNSINGLIFKNKNINDLYKCIIKLFANEELCNNLGREAYYTINNLWNSKIAAERFICLSNSLLDSKKLDYEEGPCSKAKVILPKYRF